LRWYAIVDGQEVELPNGSPFPWKKEFIQPKSRTFLPAFVQDNPYLMATIGFGFGPFDSGAVFVQRGRELRLGVEKPLPSHLLESAQPLLIGGRSRNLCGFGQLPF
jgi:hypothetical protein